MCKTRRLRRPLERVRNGGSVDRGQNRCLLEPTISPKMALSLQLETTVGLLTPTRISGASLFLDGGAAMSTCVVSYIELQQLSIICSDNLFIFPKCEG